MAQNSRQLFSLGVQRKHKHEANVPFFSISLEFAGSEVVKHFRLLC
jgi:hypothetical protein